MANLIRTIDDPCQISPADAEPADAEQLREWIVTNGLGGYASGTVCGVPTRRYHGLLIAALPAPAGPHDDAQPAPGAAGARRRPLGGPGRGGPGRPAGAGGRVPASPSSASRPACRSGGSRPADVVLEKRLVIPHLQNTVYVAYQLVGGEAQAVQLQLRPLVHFRSHDAPVDSPHPGPYRFTAWGDRYEVSVAGPMPPLRMTLTGQEPAFTLDAARTTEITYRLEAQRGYRPSATSGARASSTSS